MSDDLQEILEKAAQATHDKLGSSAGHDQVISDLAHQLNEAGSKFQCEKPDAPEAGNVCHPELNVTENGEVVAHIEVKTGRCSNIDKDKLKKYKEAHDKDIYVVLFKQDGNTPFVKKL